MDDLVSELSHELAERVLVLHEPGEIELLVGLLGGETPVLASVVEVEVTASNMERLSSCRSDSGSSGLLSGEGDVSESTGTTISICF